MADKLQKYKFHGGASIGANTAKSGPTTRKTTKHANTKDMDQPSTTPSQSPDMEPDNIKAEILATLRDDFKEIMRTELKMALAEDFGALKTEIQSLKTELVNDTKILREEMENMRTDIQGVESGLSTWSDEVTSLRDTVLSLKKEVVVLRDKCEDMEGRMRRCNIRIAGMAEKPNSSTPASVASALKTMLNLNREPKVERSHRAFTRQSPGDRDMPRVIIAKLHYDHDAAEILRKARENAPLHYNGHRVSIFPDYTANVAKARAAFTPVRNILRGQKEIRYGLFYPARFRITYQDDTKEFVDPQKAMSYARSILPSDQDSQLR